MANADTPFGLRPVRHRAGAYYNGSVTPYYVEASYATALYIGDPVVKNGTANTTIVEAAGAGRFLPGTLPAVVKATAGDGNPITGVIVGIAATPNGLDDAYRVGSKEAVLFVCDDPEVWYEVQCSGTLAPTAVGQNGNLIFTHAGNDQYAISGAEIAPTTATLATSQLSIQRFVDRVDNDPGSANAKVLVRINNHTEAGASVGL